jgi:hypothetical protein
MDLNKKSKWADKHPLIQQKLKQGMPPKQVSKELDVPEHVVKYQYYKNKVQPAENSFEISFQEPQTSKELQEREQREIAAFAKMKDYESKLPKKKQFSFVTLMLIEHALLIALLLALFGIILFTYINK